MLRDVSSDCTVVGIPGRIIRTSDRETLPDLEAEAIGKLFEKIKILEAQVRSLKAQTSPQIEPEKLELPAELVESAKNRAIEAFFNGAGI